MTRAAEQVTIVLRGIARIAYTMGFLAFVVYAFAIQTRQATAQNPPSLQRGITRGDSDDEPDPQSPLADMLVKRRIKLAEKEHDENVQRAKEAAQLGTELKNAFEKNNQLSQPDFKKLERIEKLARKIRDEAGGEDDEGLIENAPHDVGSAVKQISEISNSLREDVENTSRLIVSTSIIDQSNQLIDLIKVLRSFGRASN
jgi:hypothetical protein